MAKILEDLKDLMEAENQEAEAAETEEEEDEREETEAETEEDVDSGDDDSDEEEKPEVKKDDTETDSENDDEDIRVSKNEYYAMRRKAQKAENQPKQEETSEDDYEKQLLNEALQEIKIKKAARELQAMEGEFVRTTGAKDYEDITNGYRNSVYQSMRVLNPRATHDDLLDMTRKQILMKASEYYNQGLDPIAEMYFEAKQLGFKEQTKQEDVESEEQPKKKTSNLKTVAKNKKRSSGMAGAPSSGKTAPADNISPAEFAKLTPDQKRAYLSQ